MTDAKQEEQTTTAPDITEEALQEKIDAEVRALTDPLERAQHLQLLIERTPETDMERRDQLATEVRAALGESAKGDAKRDRWAKGIQLNARLDLARAADTLTFQTRAKAAMDSIAALPAGRGRIAGLIELQDIVKDHAG